MSETIIENKQLRVGVNAAYGARVVSLFDKSSGREWLTQGAESPNTGEDARYWGEEAVGWDECFPTVSPWDAGDTAWRRPLRDHGDLWGRPWAVDSADAASLSMSYADRQFRFARTLRLEGATLLARYAAANLGSEPLPYLWAFHALLAVTPEDRIELPGVDKVRAAALTLAGKQVPASSIAWTGPNGVLPFSLNQVQPRSSGFAGKFYASGLPAGSARIGHPGQWLELSWDPSIEHLGIWLTYGGWPAPGGHQEVAVEPTNAAADHLGQAMLAGTPPLQPGETREWQVTLTLRH